MSMRGQAAKKAWETRRRSTARPLADKFMGVLRRACLDLRIVLDAVEVANVGEAFAEQTQDLLEQLRDEEGPLEDFIIRAIEDEFHYRFPKAS